MPDRNYSTAHLYRIHPMRLRSHVEMPISKHVHTFQVRPYGLAKMNSIKDTRDFLCLLRCEPDIAKDVDIIEVFQEAAKRLAFKTIRRILNCTTNITSLTLRLSFERAFLTLPTTLEFKNLTILDSNIPHTAIAHFLARHPRITDLVLDVCNATPSCPLVNSHLPKLKQLTCPPGCVRALTPVASCLHRLRVVQHTAQDSSFPLEHLLDSHHITPTSILTVLHLDFDHTASQFGLLQRISEAAPGLTVLKLTESMFSDKSLSEPMPWDDADRWGEGLGSLVFLERLLIQMSRSLRERSSGEVSDGEDWLGPAAVQPKHEGLEFIRQCEREDNEVQRWLLFFSPPCLTQVVIWTKAFAGGAEGERMVDWRHDSLQWYKDRDQRKGIDGPLV